MTVIVQHIPFFKESFTPDSAYLEILPKPRLASDLLITISSNPFWSTHDIITARMDFKTTFYEWNLDNYPRLPDSQIRPFHSFLIINSSVESDASKSAGELTPSV